MSITTEEIDNNVHSIVFANFLFLGASTVRLKIFSFHFKRVQTSSTTKRKNGFYWACNRGVF